MWALGLLAWGTVLDAHMITVVSSASLRDYGGRFLLRLDYGALKRFVDFVGGIDNRYKSHLRSKASTLPRRNPAASQGAAADALR